MKKISMILVLLLMISTIIPTILASYDIVVDIQTVPGNDVEFRVLDRMTGKILDPSAVFYLTADGDGKVFINYSAAEPIIKASLTLKRNNNLIKINESNMKVFNNLMSQGINYIDVRDLINPKLIFEKSEKEEIEVPEVIVEETAEVISEENETIEEVVEEEFTEEIEAQQSAPMTGAVISGTKNIIKSKITYLIIIGLVVVFLVVLVLKKGFVSMPTSSKKDNFKVVSLSEKRNEQRINSTLSDQRIDEIERKIKEAKYELDEVANKRGKLKQAEEKIKKDREEFKKDKEELERLKRD